MPDELKKDLFVLFRVLRRQVKLERERDRVIKMLKNPFSKMLGLYDENTGGRVDDTSKEDDEDKF